MATYNKNKPKSNVAKSAKKSSFKFKWWMAVVGVGIIALVGIVVLRFSHAGTNVVGRMSIHASSKDGRFYANYWACRDEGYPFTKVLVSYDWGSNLKETYTYLWINGKGGAYSTGGPKGATLFSITADMRLTNYLGIMINKANLNSTGESNSVRVGTLPYCHE